MAKIWSKNSDSSDSLFRNLALEEGLYTFKFDDNTLSRFAIKDVSTAAIGKTITAGGRNITVVSVIDVKEKGKNFFEVDIEVGEKKFEAAGFQSVALILGALGILAIWFLVEVRKTFAPKTLFPLAVVALISLFIIGKLGIFK
jgi:hypothetical protein